MIDPWDPDYDLYLESLDEEDDDSAEEYSFNPIKGNPWVKRGSERHHDDCEYIEGSSLYDCACEGLWRAEWERRRERESEETHEEWWT